jgi:hypothetical protein
MLPVQAASVPGKNRKARSGAATSIGSCGLPQTASMTTATSRITATRTPGPGPPKTAASAVGTTIAATTTGNHIGLRMPFPSCPGITRSAPGTNESASWDPADRPARFRDRSDDGVAIPDRLVRRRSRVRVPWLPLVEGPSKFASGLGRRSTHARSAASFRHDRPERGS